VCQVVTLPSRVGRCAVRDEEWERHDRLDDELLARVRDAGYAVLAVFDPEEAAPPFTYTLGAWRSFSHPEVVVVGVEHDLGTLLVESCLERVQAGERFEPGRHYDGFLEELPVCFERVDLERYRDWFEPAHLVYQDGDFPMLQLVVPDGEGRWPWDPGVDRDFVTAQPVLTASGRPESHEPKVQVT